MFGKYSNAVEWIITLLFWAAVIAFLSLKCQEYMDKNVGGKQEYRPDTKGERIACRLS